MTRFFLLLICCGGYWVAMGQSVKVAGKILDGELGSEVFGATAALYEETNLVTGVTSDLDGVYELEVDPGSYQLIISYLGYESDTTQLTLAAGDAHYEETLLYTESTLMEEVTVVDQAIQSSEIAIYKKKQNGLNSIDGITLDLIKRTGDNNLAKALTRVVGVSIEDGKYVSVRGLGDRYSKTILNGGEMPALDPERNTAQLDIFPSNLIDNITVYKSFTPDLPGSFTGGLVDIQTKSHPEKMLLNFSASFGFNPVANFRDDFLSYESSSTDVFGFDDGLRDIPAIVREVEAGYQLDNGDPNETETINTIPVVGISTRDSARAFLADEVSRSFPAFYTIREKQSGLNQNYQLSLGNKFNLLGKPLGFVVGLSYRLGYQYYEDYQVGRYTLQDSSRVRIDQEVTGQYAKENALWGAVAGISYKPTTSSKISFTYMRNQSGGNETRRQQGFYDEGAPDELVNETMSFQQRSLDVFQLKGSHKLGKIDFNWIATQTNARDEQPDFRIFSYFRGTRDFPKVDENGVVIIGDDGLPIFEETQVADFRKSVNVNPFRFYRFMEELNRDAKLYFSWPFQLN
ncbi:MAG: carboxypeptidase-like regulatory domain-containing protein, partial [Bacteroidota bacterium]